MVCWCLMRGNPKAFGSYAAAKMAFNYMDEKNDPMNLRNNVVARGFIKDSVLCAVINKDAVLCIEERAGILAGEYARQAFDKFGVCRVMFYKPGEGHVWREIRWKNSNVGTLYRRPSFMTVVAEDVPPELQVAMLCVS